MKDTQEPLISQKEVEPNKAHAIKLLSAAAKSGDDGTISLAAQLAGVSPCVVCGYVHYKCKCKAQSN